jgi:hypothetical protein
VARGGRQLVIACGALSHEIAALRAAYRWLELDVHCLPPELHNRPERIAPAVGEAIAAHRADYDEIFVAYADCGTTGALDAVWSASKACTATSSSPGRRPSPRWRRASPGASS